MRCFWYSVVSVSHPEAVTTNYLAHPQSRTQYQPCVVEEAAYRILICTYPDVLQFMLRGSLAHGCRPGQDIYDGTYQLRYHDTTERPAIYINVIADSDGRSPSLVNCTIAFSRPRSTLAVKIRITSKELPASSVKNHAPGSVMMSDLFQNFSAPSVPTASSSSQTFAFASSSASCTP